MDEQEDEFGGLKMGSANTDDDDALLDDEIGAPGDLDFGSDDPEDNFS